MILFVPKQRLGFFDYFYAFDINIWLCTLFSMMLLGFLQSLFCHGSIRKTFAEVFQYLRILMSEVMTKRHKMSSIRWKSQRIL